MTTLDSLENTLNNFFKLIASKLTKGKLAWGGGVFIDPDMLIVTEDELKSVELPPGGSAVIFDKTGERGYFLGLQSTFLGGRDVEVKVEMPPDIIITGIAADMERDGLTSENRTMWWLSRRSGDDEPEVIVSTVLTPAIPIPYSRGIKYTVKNTDTSGDSIKHVDGMCVRAVTKK